MNDNRSEAEQLRRENDNLKKMIEVMVNQRVELKLAERDKPSDESIHMRTPERAKESTPN